MSMHVTSLARYPIKGCRGHALESATIDRYGVAGDRRLMLTDNHGSFISQREVPLLATILPSLEGELLVIRAPIQQPFELRLDVDGPLRPVELWGQDIWATDQGDDVAAWFADAIGQPCRLVWFGPGSQRPLDPAYSPRADAETAFADGYPLLATLEESLADLNRRLADPVPMTRFRPNVVVTGAPAWSEDNWRGMEIGALRFDAVKPCERCTVTTTDQITGARDPGREPLKTLASFRTVPGMGAMFGQNLVPETNGVIRVGDLVVA